MIKYSLNGEDSRFGASLHRRGALLLSFVLLLLVSGPVLSGTSSAGRGHPLALAPAVPVEHDATDSDPPWWQELTIVSVYPIFNQWGRYVDATGLGCAAETEQARDFCYREMGRVHAQGGQYLGQISAANSNPGTHEVFPELASAAVIDIYGEPVSSSDEWASGVLAMNTNHPVWQDFVMQLGRRYVDLGMNGIFIDSPLGTVHATGQPGGSFGEPDMSMFRDYLSNHYTAQELEDLFGITDIETFDYGDYIHDLGLADTWMDTPWEVPLWNDFYTFQREANEAFIARLVTETKQYAETTYDRTIAFTANLFGLNDSHLVLADLMDYVSYEYPYVEYGYPPQSQAVPEFKLATALGDGPGVAVPAVTSVIDLSTQESVSTLLSIFIAESYASQGRFMVWHEYWGAQRGQYTDLEGFMPVCLFVRNSPFLYTDLESMARTAVLFSYATQNHLSDPQHASWRGLNYALLDGQVQYDVVAMGDDIWMPDTFTQTSLAPHDLVFMPRLAYLTDEQVDILLPFVDDGGTIVAWGETGRYDETGQEVDRPELAALREPGTHAYGNGWFVSLTWDPGDAYRQTHDPAVRQQLVSYVSDHADPVTTTSAERTLNVLAYERLEGKQLVAHLVNYDYDIETDEVEATGSFTLTVKADPPLLAQDDLQLCLLSPHREEPHLLDFAVEGEELVIPHPGTSVYDVLIGLSEADAKALANETLDRLDRSVRSVRLEGYDTSSLSPLLAQIDSATGAANHLFARQLALDALDELNLIRRRRVLFDEAHEEKNTISWERALVIEPGCPECAYLGKLVAILDDEFTFERNADAPLTTELLSPYDALMLTAPNRPLSAAEVQAVRDYVAEGGGLLIIGDAGLDMNAINPLSTRYGITFDNEHCVFESFDGQEGAFLADDFVHHPATPPESFLYYAWGGNLKVESSATALGVTDPNAWQDANGSGVYDEGDTSGPFTMVAAHASGEARVAVVADNDFRDVSFEYTSNDVLARSLLRWVGRWHPIHEHHVFLPAVLRGG